MIVLLDQVETPHNASDVHISLGQASMLVDRVKASICRAEHLLLMFAQVSTQ